MAFPFSKRLRLGFPLRLRHLKEGVQAVTPEGKIPPLQCNALRHPQTFLADYLRVSQWFFLCLHVRFILISKQIMK